MNQITLEGFEQMGTFDLSNKEHLSRLTLLAHTYSNKKGTKKLIELNDRWINEALSQNKNLDPTYFNDLAKNGSVETRIEIAKRNNITSAVLTKLSYDSNSQVLLACAANPKNSAKNLHHLSNTSSFGILCEIAKNPNTSIDTLREIQIDRLKNDSDEPAIKVKNFIDKRINEKITIAKEMEKQISEIPWLKNKTPNDSLKVLDDGTVIYFQNGVKHRDNGPAIVGADGSESWYQNGKLHRENAPAIIGRDGTEKWYLNGNPHREVGPAVLYPNGTRYYYQNGLLNRGNDKPAVVFPDGEKYWYQGGKLHRENKPAIVKPDGTQMYYKKGLLHRENGPAIQWDNGEQEYALQGFKIDKQEFDQKISLKKEISEIVKKEISPPSTEIKTSHRGRSL